MGLQKNNKKLMYVLPQIKSLVLVSLANMRHLCVYMVRPYCLTMYLLGVSWFYSDISSGMAMTRPRVGCWKMRINTRNVCSDLSHHLMLIFLLKNCSITVHVINLSSRLDCNNCSIAQIINKMYCYTVSCYVLLLKQLHSLYRKLI